LSGAMLLEYLGWPEAAALIEPALAKTIARGRVTYDLARQIDGAEEISCSAFGRAVAEAL